MGSRLLQGENNEALWKDVEAQCQLLDAANLRIADVSIACSSNGDAIGYDFTARPRTPPRRVATELMPPAEFQAFDLATHGFEEPVMGSNPGTGLSVDLLPSCMTEDASTTDNPSAKSRRIPWWRSPSPRSRQESLITASSPVLATPKEKPCPPGAGTRPRFLAAAMQKHHKVAPTPNPKNPGPGISPSILPCSSPVLGTPELHQGRDLRVGSTSMIERQAHRVELGSSARHYVLQGARRNTSICRDGVGSSLDALMLEAGQHAGPTAEEGFPPPPVTDRGIRQWVVPDTRPAFGAPAERRPWTSSGTRREVPKRPPVPESGFPWVRDGAGQLRPGLSVILPEGISEPSMRAPWSGSPGAPGEYLSVPGTPSMPLSTPHTPLRVQTLQLAPVGECDAPGELRDQSVYGEALPGPAGGLDGSAIGMADDGGQWVTSPGATRRWACRGSVGDGQAKERGGDPSVAAFMHYLECCRELSGDVQAPDGLGSTGVAVAAGSHLYNIAFSQSSSSFGIGGGSSSGSSSNGGVEEESMGSNHGKGSSITAMGSVSQEGADEDPALTEGRGKELGSGSLVPSTDEQLGPNATFKSSARQMKPRNGAQIMDQWKSLGFKANSPAGIECQMPLYTDSPSQPKVAGSPSAMSGPEAECRVPEGLSAVSLNRKVSASPSWRLAKLFPKTPST